MAVTFTQSRLHLGQSLPILFEFADNIGEEVPIHKQNVSILKQSFQYQEK